MLRNLPERVSHYIFEHDDGERMLFRDITTTDITHAFYDMMREITARERSDRHYIVTHFNFDYLLKE